MKYQSTLKAVEPIEVLDIDQGFGELAGDEGDGGPADSEDCVCFCYQTKLFSEVVYDCFQKRKMFECGVWLFLLKGLLG